MRRALRLFAMLAGAGVAAGAVGFVWFVSVASHKLPPPPQADGIVALTGGADRVETALRLLAAGRARHLLVSGAGGNVELATLAHLAGVDPAPIADRVTLGRDATTTRGNATETAAWARANGIHTVIVVTALYHMPRALTEIARAAPWLTLYPVPVTPHVLRDDGGRATRLRLMAEEYIKFLAASLDLTALVPTLHARSDAAHATPMQPDRAPDSGPADIGPHRAAPTDDAAHQDNARADEAHAG